MEKTKFSITYWYDQNHVDGNILLVQVEFGFKQPKPKESHCFKKKKDAGA